MRKVIVMMILLLFVLCACNQQDEVAPATITQITNTAQNTQQPEKAIVDNKPMESEKTKETEETNNEAKIEETLAIAKQTRDSKANSIQPAVETGHKKVTKNNISKEERMKDEIEKIYKGITATIDIGNAEIGGEEVVSCLLAYPSDINPRIYLSQLKAAENIISRYENDEYATIIISMESPSLKKYDIFLGYYGTIILNENVDQLNEIMNNNKKYLSLDEAIKTLEKWLSAICPDTENLFNNVRIEDDDVFYMYDFFDINRTFYVNASDGSISTFFDGFDYMPVEYATDNQVEAVLSYLKSQNQYTNNMQNVKALLIDNKYVDLLCDEVSTPFLIEERDGILNVEPYEEFLGD